MGFDLRDTDCYLTDKDGNVAAVCQASIADFEFKLPPIEEAELNELGFALMENSEVHIECKYDYAFARLIARMYKEFVTYRKLRHIAAHTKKRRIRKKAVKRMTKLGWREHND